jgi:hypothetical protein
METIAVPLAIAEVTMKRAFAFLVLLIVAASIPALPQRHSRGSGRHYVHVSNYFRKDGTYVHPH